MKIKNIFVLFLIACLFFISAHQVPAQQTDDVVIVANKATPSSLSKEQIRLIFTGEIKNWPGIGGRIVILSNSDPNITKQFCKKYLNLTPGQLNDIWVKKIISSGFQTPPKFSSNAILTVVRQAKKYIGFVKASETDSSVNVIK